MNYSKPRRSVVTLLLVVLFCASAAAQDPAPKPSPENTAKAEAILSRATEVLGGSAYLNVTTITGRGFFTTFHDGMSQIPAKFVDYISYPDRERTEFISEGIRVIQTNSGETGWLYDGATKALSDMKGSQIEDFKRSMRTSVENLLRGWWKKEKATLTYVGRREAGVGRRNETVRLTYPDGFWIEYEFAADDGMPARILYERKHKNRETEEIESTPEEDRLHKLITIDGITAPFIIDHYRNKVQTSRIAYDTVEYNKPVADAL